MMSLFHFHAIAALRGDGLLPEFLNMRVQTETPPEPLAKENTTEDSAREGVESQPPADLGEYRATRKRL